MALNARSLLLYGIEVTALNSSLDFQSVLAGPEKQATLTQGFYSATSFVAELARAMNAIDPANIYTVTVDRTVMGGTQNRITISTNGGYLKLLFATGTRAASTIAALAGFNVVDYSGATAYTGSASTGTGLSPSYIGYKYLDDNNMAKVFGSVNVSASGLKESVVFNIQKFIQVQYMFEFAASLSDWKTFWYWTIQQRPFDFTPEITSPENVYQVTLEKTEYDNKGLGFMMKEMTPNFVNRYDTGLITLRIIEAESLFT